VLGVDIDERMVDQARRFGLPVEVAAFESGRPPDEHLMRSFRSGTGWTRSWARRRRPTCRGRVAVSPAVGTCSGSHWRWGAFSAVYRQASPDLPFNPWARPALDAHAVLFSRAAEGVRDVGGFYDPEEWRFEWEWSYERDEWLE
jgi:hypothetical protein